MWRLPRTFKLVRPVARRAIASQKTSGSSARGRAVPSTGTTHRSARRKMGPARKPGRPVPARKTPIAAPTTASSRARARRGRLHARKGRRRRLRAGPEPVRPIGTYCGTAGRCVDLPTVGQSCAGNAGEGTFCVNGVCNPLTSLCVPFLSAGQTCSGTACQCDGFNTQCAPSGVCLPTCAPGSACGAPGQVCCAQNLCNAGLACNGATCGVAPPGTDGGRDAHVSTGIAITPNATGYLRRDQRGRGRRRAGGRRETTTIRPERPGRATVRRQALPTPSARRSPRRRRDSRSFRIRPQPQMCTRGIAAQVLAGDGGTPAYSVIWGNIDRLRSPTIHGPDAERHDKGTVRCPRPTG